KVFQQKAAHPRSEPGSISHGSPPKMRNWRTGYWLLAIVPVSSSDSAGYWQCPRGPCRLRAAAAVFVHPFPLDTRSSDAGVQMNADYADVGIKGIMPKIVNPRLETCAIRATDSDLFAKSPECPPKKIVRYAFAQLGDEKRSARLL